MSDEDEIPPMTPEGFRRAEEAGLTFKVYRGIRVPTLLPAKSRELVMKSIDRALGPREAPADALDERSIVEACGRMEILIGVLASALEARRLPEGTEGKRWNWPQYLRNEWTILQEAILDAASVVRVLQKRRVRAGGVEPPASSVSRKRSSAELRASKQGAKQGFRGKRER